MLARHTTSLKHAFGTKDQVDPINHLIGTAAGWGGNPDKDATYIGAAPAKNNGATIYRLRVKDVPVDVSGRSASTMPRDILRKTSTMPIRSIASPQRKLQWAVAIQFGGCDGKIIPRIAIRFAAETTAGALTSTAEAPISQLRREIMREPL